jgi:sugar O-acyltransferase (sialic acid O-acetyltransferase NeuD family)
VTARREPLLLVGAGGLARETLAAARAGDRWDVVGMLDDDPARQGSTVDGVPVLGPVAAAHDHAGVRLVVCAGSARRRTGRRDLVARLGLPADRYGAVVHPAASLAAGVEVGEGSVLLAGCVVTAPQRVGRHVVAMPQVLLTHDDEVGDFVTLAGRVALAGGVRVGASAYLGAGALVRENLVIGPEALIGMGSVVLADVPAGQTWAGVPARPLVAAVPA